MTALFQDPDDSTFPTVTPQPSEAAIADESLRRGTEDKLLRALIRDALATDGAHHKQWYLFKIAARLGVRINEDDNYTPGIAP